MTTDNDQDFYYQSIITTSAELSRTSDALAKASRDAIERGTRRFNNRLQKAILQQAVKDRLSSLEEQSP